MSPFDFDMSNRLRGERLRAEAEADRLAAAAASLPSPTVAQRVARARRDLGYRMVEAGLRLAVGRQPP